MSFSHRFFLYAPFLMFVALAAGVMGYWWISAEALAKRLDAENGREIAPGVAMHFGARRIGGFPFRLDTSFDDFTLTVTSPRGPIVWHVPHFAMHRLTYASDITIFEVAGDQDVGWTADAGGRESLRFAAGAMRASLVRDDGKFVRFDLDMISVASSRFAAGRAQFHLRGDPTYDALDVVADLQAARFAGDEAQGFAKGLTHVRIEGRLAPGSLFANALDGHTTLWPALEAWRHGTGGFKVDEAAAFWGRCKATSQGAVTLDDAHRLAGSLALSLADCDSLARQAAGVTARGAHRAVLTVLSALSAREPADRNGALPATIVFRDGLIFVGPGRSLGSANFFEPVGFLHPLY